jgi:hypothetical protein
MLCCNIATKGKGRNPFETREVPNQAAPFADIKMVRCDGHAVFVEMVTKYG